MDFKQYQVEAARTMAPLKTLEENNLHMVMGMVTEAAELLNVFKNHLAYNRPVDWVNVLEEVFDLLWFIANFMRINKIDFEKGLDTNIAKLKARYPGKYSDENANHRDLDAERKVLENC